MNMSKEDTDAILKAIKETECYSNGSNTVYGTDGYDALYVTSNNNSITISGTTNSNSTEHSNYTKLAIENSGWIGPETTTPNTKLTVTDNNTITLNMNQIRQVQVAIFEIERNDENKVVRTKFLKQVWVEQKPNTALELIVAKHLDEDYDPQEIVVKELFSITF